MLTKQALILAKTEVSYGVDSGPLPEEDAILVFDLQVKVHSERLVREAVRSTLSGLPHLLGGKFAEINFSTELKGTGSAGTVPEVSPLLRGSGFSEAIDPGVDVRYIPRSADFASCTIYAYLDGLLHKIKGCRGSFEVVAAAGEQVRLNWTFQGLYQTPVDAAIPAGAVFDNTAGPVFQNASFDWGGYVPLVQQLTVAINNKLVQREAVTAPHGVAAIEIVDRSPGGTFNPEAVAESDYAFWAGWEEGAGATLQVIIGAITGNVIRLESAVGGCVKESLAWAERSGIRVYDIPFGLYSAGGDDELTITFM